MNKADLIEKVAKDCDMTKVVAEQVLNSILNTITDAVAAGDKVSLIGFGTFSVNDRAARLGRNPQTGQSIQIPARKVVKFKAGAKLAESIR
ncbi:MAG: HU family DNA-binding protein [Proteobacteria bacterium]|nr:HU family DNA-binding protein [Pseudomonadota bacterium]MBU1057876.1 HU family DNA-binding protein [Pseudomonadota bacterium]